MKNVYLQSLRVSCGGDEVRETRCGPRSHSMIRPFSSLKNCNFASPKCVQTCSNKCAKPPSLILEMFKKIQRRMLRSFVVQDEPWRNVCDQPYIFMTSEIRNIDLPINCLICHKCCWNIVTIQKQRNQGSWEP
jgi:hypothetical protein